MDTQKIKTVVTTTQTLTQKQKENNAAVLAAR